MTSTTVVPWTPMPVGRAHVALTSTVPHPTYIGRPPTGSAAMPLTPHPHKPPHDLRALDDHTIWPIVCRPDLHGRRTLRTSAGHPLR
ncbi:hypothetical protein GUJ93_ZPchr0012g20054 [Zizania palustris]|uniref:Uncharacterized protein n=1 Tax=Zizania palustris TaxID=103762 RepID=A0A8J6BZU4_ZIZPA|nr:hypothetical protein GUJ93_ZPchr0012g20054 [Zizania palustris]